MRNSSTTGNRDGGVGRGGAEVYRPLRRGRRGNPTRNGHPVELIGTVTMLDGRPLSPFEHEPKRETINPDAQLESDPKSLLDQLGQFVRSLLDDFASSHRDTQVLGCGVAVGGHVDGDKGIARSPLTPAEKDDFSLEKDLADWLKSREDGRPLDVVVEDDVTSYAVQMNLTQRPADSDVLEAIFHDGIGGAVVVNGRTWRGAHGLPAELGHLYVGSQPKSASHRKITPGSRVTSVSRRWIAATNPSAAAERWAAWKHGRHPTPFSARRTANAAARSPPRLRRSTTRSTRWFPNPSWTRR